MTTGKYGPKAARWSEDAYADAPAYLRHRGELILEVGPALRPGDSLLDLACGDGGLADYLPTVRYSGVDASPEMVEAAKRRNREVVLGDLNDHVPPAPVAATSCFRAVYYAADRRAFFRLVAGYTKTKFVFDFSPRRFSAAELRADLEAAGFDRIELRPFFSSQRRSLPGLATRSLQLLERSGPLARLLLAFRFSYVCAAYRGGKKM
jgi:SAM-dependent methyltransferase